MGSSLARAFFDRLRAHRAKLHRAVRVTVAAALAYELATRLDLPQGFWAVITAIIVMQSSVGGTLAASIERMVGTVGGAVVGAAVAVVGSWTKMPEVLELVAAIIPLSIAASVYQSMRIAPVTAAILLLANPSNIDPLLSAADRVLEIALGSVVGLAVAILVFPARAHGTLVDKAAQTITLLAEVLRNMLADLDGIRDDAAFARLHERIRASLAEAETAGVEAERERSSHLTDDPDPATLLRAIRRLRHTVILIGRASTEPLPEPALPHFLEPLHRIDDAMAEYLVSLSRSIQRRLPPPSPEAVNAALDGYDQAMLLVWKQPRTRDMPLNAVGRIFALSFALEQLRENARDLRDRAEELTHVR
jgi:uncharacterized membrane protein YccC